MQHKQRKKVFYQQVIVESDEPIKYKEHINVKCVVSAPFNVSADHRHIINRRDVLPLGFEEPMYVM